MEQYVAGVNAFIDLTRIDPARLPAEYPALGTLPRTWTLADSAAIGVYLVGQFTVFGGEQLRPNIHVEDMTDLYLLLLDQPDEVIDGKIWNAGYHNLKVRAIADMVRDEVGSNVDIVVTPTDDHRSYHVSSEKIRRDLGFVAARTVKDAIVDLKTAFVAGKVPNSMSDDRYYNIKRMQALKLR